MIILSTDLDENLADLNSACIHFSRELPPTPRNSLLRHKNKWLLASEGNCSCGFRHLSGESIELGFCRPEGWWPENERQIAATLAAFEVFRNIAEQGYRIECIDTWVSDAFGFVPLSAEIAIPVDEVEPEAFRFFEGHRFDFLSGPVKR